AQVLHCDHFGNVISNLPLRALARIKAVNGTRVRTVETYDEAEPNELVALMGSSSRIEFALREGSAAARPHTAPGATLLGTWAGRRFAGTRGPRGRPRGCGRRMRGRGTDSASGRCNRWSPPAGRVAGPQRR